MCLYPKLMKNRKYTKTKKNKGIIPQVKDKRALYVPVACGNCMECRKAKSREWQIRLHEDLKEHKNGKFVTLTFSDEALTELGEGIALDGYDLDNEIATKAVRRFLERWRKKYKKSVRHWLVTELGGTATERIHLHGIIWTDETEEISKIWKYGMITIGKRRYIDGKAVNQKDMGYVSERTVNYIVKYITKTDMIHKEYKPKMLCSNGIGSRYTKSESARLNKFKEENTREYYKNRQGYKMALPIYYRNKIYTEEEKEKLWLEKLDKEERFVDGVKIDISKGDEKYFKILEQARKKNKRLNYGNDEINWERRYYERKRRRSLANT